MLEARNPPSWTPARDCRRARGPILITPTHGHDRERADLRALLADASDGLNPNERELIELLRCLSPGPTLAAGLPAGLRAATIALATGQGAAAVAQRAAVLSRAGAFNHHGFPRSAHHSAEDKS